MTSHTSVADFLEDAMQKYADKPAFQCGPSKIAFSDLEQKSR
jgi:acyl-CoA synthetase (AMP-forming)/AMP-acid ligase II